MTNGPPDVIAAARTGGDRKGSNYGTRLQAKSSTPEEEPEHRDEQAGKQLAVCLNIGARSLADTQADV